MLPSARQINLKIKKREYFDTEGVSECVPCFNLCHSTGTQIPETRSPGELNFVQWHLLFVGPHFRTSFVSHFWYPEF